MSALLGFQVLFYRLSLSVQPADSSIEGAGEVCLVADGSVSWLNLAEDLLVDSVLVNGVAVSFWRQADTLFFPIPAETCSVAVFYRGKPSNGLHFFSKSFYAQGEYRVARNWFPCPDTPSVKAPVSVKITVPPGWLAVSNGVLDSVRGSTFFWSSRYPTAPHLIAVAGAQYSVIRDTWRGVPIEIYAFPEDSEAAVGSFRNLKEMLELYSQTFGLYPFFAEKIAFAETEDRIGVEPQTLVLVGHHTFTGDLTWEYVFAHELAHQWWGDCLTPASWADIWLNEGFAVFSDFYFTEHFYGPDSALSRWQWAKEMVWLDDTTLPPYPLYGSPHLTGLMVYYKGAWVLRMLRWMLGDSLFFSALRHYFSRHYMGLVTTQGFLEALYEATGRDFSWFFDQWVYKPGFLKVDTSWWVSGDTTYLEVRQIHQPQDSLKPFYDVPVEVWWRTDAGERLDTFWLSGPADTFALVGRALEVVLDPHQWLLMAVLDTAQSVRDTQGPLPLKVKVAPGELVLASERPIRFWLYDAAGRRVAAGWVRGERRLKLKLKPGAYALLTGGARKTLLVP